MINTNKICIVSVLFVCFGICLAVFLREQPIKIVEINSTPKAFYDNSPTVLPPDKLNKKYKFVYIYYGEVDYNAYLKKHPEVAIEIRNMGSGERQTTIFSNNPPDPEFFSR